MTAPMLARLRKLYDAAQYDAAQPGPWRAHAVGGHGYLVRDHGDFTIAMAEIDSGEVDAATGALIAEMRNALPALLAVVEAAESVRDDYDDSELSELPPSVRYLCAAVRRTPERRRVMGHIVQFGPGDPAKEVVDRLLAARYALRAKLADVTEERNAARALLARCHHEIDGRESHGAEGDTTIEALTAALADAKNRLRDGDVQ